MTSKFPKRWHFKLLLSLQKYIEFHDLLVKKNAMLNFNCGNSGHNWVKMK